MALTATDLFNDATTREIGGIGPDQVNLIVSDLVGVQQMLSAADPQINNLTDLHTHVIINQLNEEIATVELANSPTGTPILGTDLGATRRARHQRYPSGHYRYCPRRSRRAGHLQPDAAAGAEYAGYAVPRQRDLDGVRDPMDPGQQSSWTDGDHDREQRLSG